MDPNLPSPTPRKMKFRPKPPPRRDSKPVAAASQAVAKDDSDEETARSLNRGVDKHLGLRSHRSKAAKKSSEQITTLTHGSPSTGLRSLGKQNENADDGSSAAKSEESLLDESQSLVASMSTSQSGDKSSNASTTAPIPEKKKEYREPWDYENSYYPTTLPWRRPYSGNPELLDKEEFDNPPDYDETTINSAKDLGLLHQSDEQPMFLVQLHASLPVGTNVKAQENLTTLKGKEKATGIPKTSGLSTDMRGKKASGSSTNLQGCHLKNLPEGYMGKMLVYKNGDVKLKLGDILYDVSPGTPCSSAQNIAAVNTSSRHFCELGELDTKRIVITPNVDNLMGSPD